MEACLKHTMMNGENGKVQTQLMPDGSKVAIKPKFFERYPMILPTLVFLMALAIIFTFSGLAVHEKVGSHAQWATIVAFLRMHYMISGGLASKLYIQSLNLNLLLSLICRRLCLALPHRMHHLRQL